MKYISAFGNCMFTIRQYPVIYKYLCILMLFLWVPRFFRCCVPCLCFYQFLPLYNIFLLALILIRCNFDWNYLGLYISVVFLMFVQKACCYWVTLDIVICSVSTLAGIFMLHLSDSGRRDMLCNYTCWYIFCLCNVVPSFPFGVL